MRAALFAAVSVVFCLPAAPIQQSIHIDETKLRAVLEKASTSIVIPIESTLDHSVVANLSLDWVDRDENKLNSAHKTISIDPGRSSVTLPLPISKPSIWLRLRYSISLDTRVVQSGVVALPQIAQHVFELKISHVGEVHSGRTFTVHAQAIHPVTRKPVDGVQWTAGLTANGSQLVPKTVSAQAEGFFDLVFEIPPSSVAEDPDDEAKIWVRARVGDFEAEVMADTPLISRLSARMQTDKPIYQPEQIMHLRAVVLDAQGRALEGAKVTLRIEDEQGELAHSSQLDSSRFGVIQDAWTIPETASLGAYRIVLTAEGDDNYQIASHAARVSRYELPTFNVTAKPDRAAYLPGQSAKVSITGKYFFGKPVPRGRVKLIRSEEPVWSRKTHKYETAKRTLVEAQAGEDGMYIATLDLKAEHEELESNPIQRFQDVHFAAYYTDPSSGRTEQRRFDVRITREPIHVYLIGTPAGGDLPAPIYLATSYADGSPASADVELRYHGKTVALRTNKYGVGKTFLVGDETASEEIVASATDRKGQSGTWKQSYWRSGLEHLRVETSHPIYRAGDAVSVRISSPQDQSEVVRLHAVAGDRTVASRIVRLVNHSAEATFPYQPEFRRTVVFVAFDAATNTVGSQAVIFPDSADLQVSATAERASYRPGEKATLRMQVKSADGRPVEAALGLAGVDQSVLERARTDSEFGTRPWFACAFCAEDGEREIGGLSLNHLYARKPTAAISPDMELVAEALLAQTGAFVSTESSESVQDTPKFRTIYAQLEELPVSLRPALRRNVRISNQQRCSREDFASTVVQPARSLGLSL